MGDSAHTETLYILGSNATGELPGLLPEGGIVQDTAVILVQDAVTLTNLPVPSVHVLEEDLRLRQTTSAYPGVSYAGMLQMIFEAKRVVVV